MEENNINNQSPATDQEITKTQSSDPTSKINILFVSDLMTQGSIVKEYDQPFEEIFSDSVSTVFVKNIFQMMSYLILIRISKETKSDLIILQHPLHFYDLSDQLNWQESNLSATFTLAKYYVDQELEMENLEKIDRIDRQMTTTIKAAEYLKKRFPEAKIVIMSIHPEDFLQIKGIDKAIKMTADPADEIYHRLPNMLSWLHEHLETQYPHLYPEAITPEALRRAIWQDETPWLYFLTKNFPYEIKPEYNLEQYLQTDLVVGSNNK